MERCPDGRFADPGSSLGLHTFGYGTAASHWRRFAASVRSVGAILLDAALDMAGLKVADITIVSSSLDEHLATQPEDASKRMAIRQGLTSAEVLASYDGLKLPELSENHSLLKGKPPQLEQIVNALSKFMFSKKFLKSPLNIDRLTDGRFLPGDRP